ERATGTGVGRGCGGHGDGEAGGPGDGRGAQAPAEGTAEGKGRTEEHRTHSMTSLGESEEHWRSRKSARGVGRALEESEEHSRSRKSTAAFVGTVPIPRPARTGTGGAGPADHAHPRGSRGPVRVIFLATRARPPR